MLGRGGFGLALGVGILAFTAVRVVILLGLLTLSPWAWKAGVALYSLAAVVDLLRIDIIGMSIALIVTAYIYAQKDLFRGY